MGVNRNKPDRWKEDIARSVDMYNAWFMEFAPQTFRETRIQTTKAVKHALSITGNLSDVSAAVLHKHPEILPTLRMATCPPLAVDRLIGLSGASPHLVKTMEKKGNVPPGTFSFRTNVPVSLENGKAINIPVDAVVMPLQAKNRKLPVLIEAKSAGDFTNVNKRRKEEAAKMSQLRKTYGKEVSFNLFLCGYFDSGYLGYEAAEGIDWIWEHRIDDLALLGL